MTRRRAEIPGGERNVAEEGGEGVIFVVTEVGVGRFAWHAVFVEIWAPKSEVGLKRGVQELNGVWGWELNGVLRYGG